MTDPALPPDDIKRLRELCAAATPGPWKCWNGWGPHTDGLMRVLRLGPETRDGLWVNDGGDIVGRAEDFEFIAISRTALPAALDRIEALEKECERLRRHGRPRIGPGRRPKP